MEDLQMISSKLEEKEEELRLMKVIWLQNEEIIDKLQTINSILEDELEEFKWIPVGEELPEEDTYVEVTIKKYKTLHPEIKETFLRKGEWACEDEITRVTAWRPLAKPYSDGKGVWGIDYE